MPPTDAVTLTNWYPTPSDVQVRQGYTSFATGFAAAVETLAPYNADTQNKLFACSNGNIYDITSGGAIGAAVQSGLTNNRWQHVNYTTTGGTRYLCMFNGVDSPRYWDGSAWTTITGVSTPALTCATSCTPQNIITCTSHKARLWLVRKNSLELYYCPVGAVGGAAALYDLRPVFKRGGVINSIETWSADSGTGLDDRLVIATSQGEIAIYQGTDPSSASTWSLIGVFYVGGVIGTRSLCKFGGDVLVICQYGLLPVSALLLSKVINLASALTDKIQYAISLSVSSYAANFGWQCTSFPENNMLVMNIPVSATQFNQYVMNTITGAWCQFTGWNGSCWTIYQDNLYYGGSNFVAQAWSGYDDAGSNIVTDYQSAFDAFGAPGQLKQFSMVRPIISSDGSPGIAYGINIDFSNDAVSGTPSFSPSTVGTWDGSTWDSGIWGGGLAIQKGWQFASGLGYWGAFRMVTSSRGIQVRMSSVDYLFEAGGVI